MTHPSPAPAASAPPRHPRQPPPDPRPDAQPGTEPSAGTASTPDGVATAGWPANAFTHRHHRHAHLDNAAEETQGFAAGSYIAQLKAQTTNGTPIARFEAPLVLHFGSLAPGLVPAYSADGTTWTPLPRSTSSSLPTGIDRRYTQAQDGSIDIATLVPGSFGLLLDTARPSRPTVTARLSRGALQLRWQPATDNSTSIAGYRITFGGKPILTLAGTTTPRNPYPLPQQHHQRLPGHRRRLRREPERRLQEQSSSSQDPNPNSQSNPSRDGPGS